MFVNRTCHPSTVDEWDVLFTNINHVEGWNVLFTNINHVDGWDIPNSIPMVYRSPYPWYIDPLPMAYRILMDIIVYIARDSR
jgi:hypothetical protein